MPALDGPQFKSWYEKWQDNVSASVESMPAHERPMLQDERLYNWGATPFFGKSEFPNRTLMSRDPAMLDPSKHWDPSPSVSQRQAAPKRPKDAPEAHEVDLAPTEVQHAAMRGTGVPSHVTVYHFGDPPKGARYASGSVDPNWPKEVRSGGVDPSVNKGRLHIFLVPHENILATMPGEHEVFFRRGTQLNKTKRTKRQQQKVEQSMEETWGNW